MTPDEQLRAGSAWDQTKINLTQDQTLSFVVYLGNQDVGADGIAFVLQNEGTNAIGENGRNLGFGGATGITPAIAVEVDTYQNSEPDDPPEDHMAPIAIGEDNELDHLAPVYNFGERDIEDDREHWLLVKWEAGSQTLRVYWDGWPRVTYQQDLINEIFGGESTVYYGLTASTGAFNNLQYFYEGIPTRYVPGGSNSGGDYCLAGGGGSGGGADDYEYYPINTLTGALDYSTTDLSFSTAAGPLTFERFYVSLATGVFTDTWYPSTPYTTTLGYAGRITTTCVCSSPAF